MRTRSRARTRAIRNRRRPRRRAAAAARHRRLRKRLNRPRRRVLRRPSARSGGPRALRGHVDLIGLGNLLQLLSMNRMEGVLVVARGREKQSIGFGPEGLRLLASTGERVKRLSRLARKLSGPTLITPDRLKKLLGREKLLGWTLGHVLDAREELTKEKIEEALRVQVEEEILDLFVWEKALFAFEEGRPGRSKTSHPLAKLAIRADVTALLLEAARRADELRQIRLTLPNDAMKVQKIPREILADELGPDIVRVDAILPLINGRRTLKAILEASIYPKFATMRAVHKLLTLGYAKARDRSGDTVVLAGGPAISHSEGTAFP